MFRRFSTAFLALLLLAACAAQPAPAPTPAPSAAPSPSAAPGPSPSAAPEVSEAIILDRCPTYGEAMAAVSGPGDSGEQLDAETCLQNAYALAAALYNGDAGVAAAACDAAAADTDRAASAEDIFPFADLSGLQLQGFSFSGGGAGEPLWLTLSVAAPGETMLPGGHDHLRGGVRGRLVCGAGLCAGACGAAVLSAPDRQRLHNGSQLPHLGHRPALAGRQRPAAAADCLLSVRLCRRARP